MASAWRNLTGIALFGGIAVIAVAWVIPARAEIDLNRLVFPKVPSSNVAPAEAEDPPPAMPGTQRDDQNREASQHNTRPAENRHATTRNAPASYQSGGANYQSPPASYGTQSQSRATSNADSMNSNPSNDYPTSGSRTNRAAINRSDLSGNNDSNRTSATYGSLGFDSNGAYGEGGYSNSGYGNGGANAPRAGWSLASMFGMEQPPPANGIRMANAVPSGAPQSVMRGGVPSGIPPGNRISERVASTGSPNPTARGTINRPAVTPEAVYLDGEPIPPGTVRPGSQNSGRTSMPSGQVMMEGDPMMMGRSGDGFTSPYCNDCNGGHPGGCGNSEGGCFSGLWGAGRGNCSNCSPCDGDCGDCGQCRSCPYGRPWILAPIDFVLYVLGPPGDGSWWWGENFSVFGGVHNFKSPVNLIGQSNFGTQEGVNWALPIWAEIGLGGQIGIGVTQSNFQDSGFPFDDYRNQTFVTGGLFHRPACGQGLQYGLVFDWLHDEFYDNFDIAQLRGEISWLFDRRDEIGFWFASGVIDDRVNHQFLAPANFEVIDQYAFFYRRRFCQGGDARLWGGFTGNDAGLIGADFSLPVVKCWSIEGGFNYVITDHHTQGLSDETWNLGMNLVWSWGCNACCPSAYRPLFNVADNGSLLTRVIEHSQVGF
jgi:hypothetical protein